MIAKRDFNSIRLLLPSMLRYLDRNGLNSILKFPSSFQENIGFDIDGREFWMRQVIDVKRISIPIQLKSEDRNSMANSIETRAPFLDYRLVESGISLPLDFKLKNGFGKWIVREMMKNSLPEEIRTSKMKRGFDVSADWISMGLGDYIRERLNEKRYLFKDFFIPGKDVNEFTDSYLLKKKGAFQEATTLIWLSKFL
jgi:asparagine synthase (glutamine-hydrolysing)